MVRFEDAVAVAGRGDGGARGAGPFDEEVRCDFFEGGGAGEGFGVEHCGLGDGGGGLRLACCWFSLGLSFLSLMRMVGVVISLMNGCMAAFATFVVAAMDVCLCSVYWQGACRIEARRDLV